MSKQNKKNGKFISKAFIVFAVLVAFFALLGFNEETNETSNANYMFEGLAVIDNNLGTNLLENVSRFFDKLFGTGVITSVSGSDGWDRADLKTETIKLIISSTYPKLH